MKCMRCNYTLPDDSDFCQYCGTRLAKARLTPGAYANTFSEKPGTAAAPKAPAAAVTTPLPGIDNTTPDKVFSVIRIFSIIVSVIAIVCAIAAMNMQDSSRNIYESANPTVLYCICVGTHVISIALFLLCLKQRFPIAQHLFAFIPSFFAIGTLIEGSLFSDSYLLDGASHVYVNNDLVSIFNTVWVLASFIILIINLDPLKTNVRSKWRASIRYRERCYKRVEKMKGYLDKGIITEEQYEKNKQELLKNINM